jgi:hypothetical protein
MEKAIISAFEEKFFEEKFFEGWVVKNSTNPRTSWSVKVICVLLPPPIRFQRTPWGSCSQSSNPKASLVPKKDFLVLTKNLIIMIVTSKTTTNVNKVVKCNKIKGIICTRLV